MALGNGNRDSARAVIDGINRVKGTVDSLKIAAPIQI